MLFFQIDATIRPGLTSLTWSSMNTDTYFESVRNALTDVGGLIKQVLLNCVFLPIKIYYINNLSFIQMDAKMFVTMCCVNCQIH